MKALLQVQARVFGLSVQEWTVVALLLTALASAGGDVTSWTDVLQPHFVLAACAQSGAGLLAFAMGRYQRATSTDVPTLVRVMRELSDADLDELVGAGDGEAIRRELEQIDVSKGDQ